MPDFEVLKKWAKDAWEKQSSWREGALEDFSFVAGPGQWTTEERNWLKEESRVPIVFNRTATIVNAVAGSEINNRTEVRFLPREIGDAKPNEILTSAAGWFRDQANAEDSESQAFSDSLVCGMGWTETRLDFDEDPEGAPVVDHCDPTEMFWDPAARKKGLTDSRYRGRAREISIHEARDLFPDASDEDLHANWIDVSEKTQGFTSSGDDYEAPESDTDEAQRDVVTIVQIQWRERQHAIEYADPTTGQRAEMPEAQWGRLSKIIGLDRVPHRKTKKWIHKQAFLGRVMLGEVTSPCERHFTLQPITAYYDKKERVWFGLLRPMKDPQKFANKWLSASLHIVNSNAKGGLIVEEDAIGGNQADFEESFARADAISVVTNGALAAGKIQPKPQAQYPAAMMNLTEFAISSIRDASGVNQELLGLRDSNQPGILEYQRKQAAMTTLAQLFDALRFYRKKQGEVILYFIESFLADGRLVRITGDEGDARYVPLLLDGETRKYDVIVDDAPASPNNRERVWETITQMMPMLGQAGLPPQVWAEIIEYSPFPTALIEKLKEFAAKPQVDPAAQMMGQLEVEQAKAEVEKTQAEAQENFANAEENQAQALLAMVRAGQERMNPGQPGIG